jgi:septal ring factor EnvC (AmiA/AmiB activator)
MRFHCAATVAAKTAGGGAVAMSDGQSIDAATRRLTQALDALEAAVERRREADRSEAALAAQVQALGDDRARLAADLDAVSARARQLETANRDVVRRLDLAMQSIRSVIEGSGR